MSVLSEAGYELKSGPTLLQVAIKCFGVRADDETLAAQLPSDLSCFLFLSLSILLSLDCIRRLSYGCSNYVVFLRRN